MKNSEILRQLGACRLSQIYADNFNTLQEAWENCTRPDWMIWLLIRTNKDKNKLSLFLCDLLYMLVPNNEIIEESTTAIKEFIGNKINLEKLIRIKDRFCINDNTDDDFDINITAHTAIAAICSTYSECAYTSAFNASVSISHAYSYACYNCIPDAKNTCKVIRKTYPNVDELMKGN